MWSQGGVYVDTDFESIVALDVFLRSDDEFVSAEDNGNDWLFNAFMASTSRHPLAHALMMEAVRRVELRSYTGNPLSVTGPVMAACVFRHITGKSPLTFVDSARTGNGTVAGIRLLQMHRPGQCYFGVVRDPARMATLGALFYSDYLEKRAEMRFYRPELNGRTYNEMFYGGDIYWSNRAVSVRMADAEATMPSDEEVAEPSIPEASQSPESSIHAPLHHCTRGLSVELDRAMLRSALVNVTFPEVVNRPQMLHPRVAVTEDVITRRIPWRIAQVHGSPTLPAAEVALMQTLMRASHQAFNETKESRVAVEYEFFDRQAAINFTTTWCPEAATADAFNEHWRVVRQMDTFRYCYLWTQGGVVVDTDVELLASLDDILLPGDELVLVEYDATPTLFSGFIAAAPGNLLIHTALTAPYAIGDERLRVAFGERPSDVGRNCAAGHLLPDWKVRMLNYVHDAGCVLGVIEDFVSGDHGGAPARRSLMLRGYAGRDRRIVTDYFGDDGAFAWQNQWVRLEIDEKQFKPLEDGVWSPTLCFPQWPSATRDTLANAYPEGPETQFAAGALDAPSRGRGPWPPLVDLTTLPPVSIVLPIVHRASEAPRGQSEAAVVTEGVSPEEEDVPFQWVLTWCTLAKKIFAFDSVAVPCEQKSVVAQYRNAACAAVYGDAVTVHLIGAAGHAGSTAGSDRPRGDADATGHAAITGVFIRARAAAALGNASDEGGDSTTTTMARAPPTGMDSAAAIATGSNVSNRRRQETAMTTPSRSNASTSLVTPRPWIDVFVRCDADMLPDAVAVDATAVAIRPPPVGSNDVHDVAETVTTFAAGVTYTLHLKSRCACVGGCGMAAWFSQPTALSSTTEASSKHRAARQPSHRDDVDALGAVTLVAKEIRTESRRSSGATSLPADMHRRPPMAAPVTEGSRPLLSPVNRTAFELWLRQHLGLSAPLVPPDHLRRCLRRVPRHHRECLQHGSWCVASTTGVRRGGPKPLRPATCEVNRRDAWLSLSLVDAGGRRHNDAAPPTTTCGPAPAPGLVNASSLERCLAAVADAPGVNVVAFCEPPRRTQVDSPALASTAVSGNRSSPAAQGFQCLAARCSPTAAIVEAAVALRSVKEAVKAQAVAEKRLSTMLPFESCDVWVRNAFAHRGQR